MHAGQFIGIHAIDALRHRPSSPGILRFELRYVSLHDGRSVHSKLLKIVTSERRSGADDVTAEPDTRRFLDREQMSAHHVFDIGAPVQQFIDLEIRIIERLTNAPVIIFFRKKARGAKHEAWQSRLMLNQPAETFRRYF